MTSEAPTPRTRVRRLPELGVYERARVHAIIDEALYCHLSWVGDDGDPRVIPTIHARIDDTLYVHGSNASTTLRAIKGGVPVAIAITIVDGIRFARSMFEHSMNYRTVVVYGRTEEVTDLGRARDRVRRDHRSGGARAAAPTRGARRPDELRQTTFVKVALDECSAKVSEGFPEEPDDDLALDVWAGILPLRRRARRGARRPAAPPDTPRPSYVTDWRRPGEHDGDPSRDPRGSRRSVARLFGRRSSTTRCSVALPDDAPTAEDLTELFTILLDVYWPLELSRDWLGVDARRRPCGSPRRGRALRRDRRPDPRTDRAAHRRRRGRYDMFWDWLGATCSRRAMLVPRHPRGRRARPRARLAAPDRARPGSSPRRRASAFLETSVPTNVRSTSVRVPRDRANRGARRRPDDLVPARRSD